MAYENPFADMMKQFNQFKAPTIGAMPSFDVNQMMSVSRKNAEACTAATQAIAESCQAITRRQAERSRAQVEKALKTCKDMLVSGSPEANTTKQVELAKTVFESNLNSLREAGEVAMKSCFEAYDLLVSRASQSIEELSATATSTTAKKKAA